MVATAVRQSLQLPKTEVVRVSSFCPLTAASTKQWLNSLLHPIVHIHAAPGGDGTRQPFNVVIICHVDELPVGECPGRQLWQSVATWMTPALNCPSVADWSTMVTAVMACDSYQQWITNFVIFMSRRPTYYTY